jgi:acyl-CoA synthetase (AMP-forming)/AMP-acid ligase II
MIFTSPYLPAEIPDVPFTPFVLRHAESLADKPALIDGASGRTLTFGQLVRAVDRVAVGLSQRGFAKGDVLAICSPNHPEYAVAFNGVATVGGINTTINPLYTADEMAYQLNDANARYLITIPEFLQKAQAAGSQSGIEEIFVFGEAEGTTPFAELLESKGDLPEVEINPSEDLVVLPYSSGTTGLPKGVMLTHRNLVANLCQIEGIIDVRDDDVILGVLPFFHIYGMTVVMSAVLNNGGTVVTMPRFDLEGFLSLMQNYKITQTFLVPPIVLALAKHPLVDEYDLSNLRVFTSGAAPLGEELERACAQRLGCLIKQGYGLTETSPVTHTHRDDPAEIQPGSIGHLIRSTEAMIIDTNTEEALGPNQEGEVLIRGAQVMKGYLNNPEATAETLDQEGWLHTGDIGYVDEDGYFYIVDRVKELIKYKGYQVAPAELEALLLTHPSIADAAVIPSPDEEAGEVPKAFIVTKGDVSAAEIMEFVASNVAPTKKVRRVEFVDEIPKSASGKILRRVLVERERKHLSESGT